MSQKDREYKVCLYLPNYFLHISRTSCLESLHFYFYLLSVQVYMKVSILCAADLLIKSFLLALHFASLSTTLTLSQRLVRSNIGFGHYVRSHAN